MPFINIKLAGQLTKEQKAEITKEVTDSVSRIANKPKESILVLIEPIERENWGKSGKLLD